MKKTIIGLFLTIFMFQINLFPFSNSKDKKMISINGNVNSVIKFSNYELVKITLRSNKKITIKLEGLENFAKGDKVYGTCLNFINGTYEKCSLYKR